jgi:Putative zincin peptidase
LWLLEPSHNGRFDAMAGKIEPAGTPAPKSEVMFLESAPDGGKGPLWKMEVRSGLMGALTLTSIALLVAAAVAFGAVAISLHPGLRVGAKEMVLALLLLIPLHEGVHALVYRAFGGRPRFGAGVHNFVPYAYVGCPGQWFSRNQFVVVALAPLIVLDLVGLLLLGSAPIAATVLALMVFNTAGAVGDLWTTAVVLQRPAWIRFQDSGTGFTAWAPADHLHDTAALRPPHGLDVPLLAWVGTWLGVTLATMLVLQIAVGLLLGHQRQIWAGPLLLGEVRSQSSGVSFSTYLLPISALAATVGAASAVIAASLRGVRSRRAPAGPTVTPASLPSEPGAQR